MLEYWLWLTGRKGIGVRGLHAILERFGSPEAVYCAADSDYPQELRLEARTSLADKELAPSRQAFTQTPHWIHFSSCHATLIPPLIPTSFSSAFKQLFWHPVTPNLNLCGSSRPKYLSSSSSASA